MTQRTERVAHEILAVLGAALSRQQIKDPRVQEAGIITLTGVRVSGDLRQAYVAFTVHGADEAQLLRVKEGLSCAAGFLRRLVGEELRAKVTPALIFEIDRVFEQEAKIDALLRRVADEDKAKKSSA